ncbi:uncharacterized protein PG986_004520 [Apiospora aurea]|uniref:3beta-hydroxysteroid 3-dehydrogenase n=1 Tax=Apiospora aurea TaxID=335848 RepID=A0ABR1QN69_9PEZI
MSSQDQETRQGGTIILTGANGSVGLAAAEHLLKSYPQYHFVFTVRDAADTDPNTRKLRDLISNYPHAKSKASVHQVDLADLSAVHEFALAISSSVATGRYPRIRSIICNAAYRDLIHDSELTVDGYDKTIQVSFVAHVALVLRLLDSLAEGGRVVLFSSNPRLRSITVVAINPGGIGDSRVFTTRTPRFVQLMQTFVLVPLMPLIRLADPTFRTSAEAAIDVIELAVGDAHSGERGYFTMLLKDDSDPVTMEKEIQDIVWRMSLEWAKVMKDDTGLQGGMEPF